jgi:hypothetical protein
VYLYVVPYLVLLKLQQAAVNARRQSRTRSYVAWSVAAGVFGGVMLAIASSLVSLLWAIRLWWMAIPFALLMVVPIFAPIIVRHALVPLGWVRAAYVGGLWSRPGEDASAYGLCCAAWAFAHAPSPRAEAWLATKRDGRIPLGDAEVVVTAFVAAGRGDVDTARSLLRSVALLVEEHPAVRELAGEWLAADAAERGAWAELHDDAIHARWPATPLTFLLEGIAARRLGGPGESGAPTRLELATRWLLAPYRRATRPLLSGVPVAAPCSAERPAGELADATVAGPLPRAISAHLELGLRGPDGDRLATAVRAWDLALTDGATHAWLARRALELDAPLGAVDHALRDITAAVTDELARAADAARLGAPASLGPVGDALARRLRHGRLDALEHAFTRWANRRHDGAARSPIDEWREFLALRTAYADAAAAGGTELRRLAFPHAFSTGNSMATWLWNTRGEYVLSYAISKWLLDEALAVGDTEAIELGYRNCGLTVPTRLGTFELDPA